MKIAVGSKNPVKVSAVYEVTSMYPILGNVEIVSIDAPSGISEQPKSLEETLRGAKNRAQAAFQGEGLAFGIESGLIEVPHTKTGMLELCACAIYDGERYHIGLSSAFECPPKVMDLVLGKGMDLNGAFKELGLTEDPKLGNGQGAVGLLTGGRINRLNYTKQAVTMAMIHVENADLY